MKKILSLMFLPLLLAGCINLDFVPSDSLTSAALATNPGAAEYTTDGIYGMMKDMGEFRGGYSQNNTFVRQYFLLNELKGDNICYSNTSTDPFWTAATLKDMANTDNCAYMWVICYKLLWAANANISGLTEDSDYSKQLKGENYFLRAFFHFTLCNLFAKPYSFGADNPGIVLRIGTDYSETHRSTVGECYKAIEDDLVEAIRLMSPSAYRGGTNRGYASKEAAQALLSRLYLYKGEWQKCIDTATECLGADPASHLEAEVKTLYSNVPTSKEVIWCVNFTDSDIANLPPKGNLASMYDSPDGTQGTGWGELYVADPLLDLFERYPQDKRYTDMIRLHNSLPGLMVNWGVMDEVNQCLTQAIALPNVNTVTGVITSSVTDNGDGTYSFTYGGKALKAIPDNTATKISDEFPGYILNDGSNTRCYVRSVMPNAIVDAKGNPVFDAPKMSIRQGGYPIWFCEKFSHQTGITFPISSSFIMLRYSEVILNRAEAYAHLGGKDTEALDDVNIIRTRAGLTGTAQMTTANIAGRGYPTALDAVLDERRMEFYYEGFRVMDLIRNKRDIDRRFPSRAVCEVIKYDDVRLQYQIPLDETNVTGIPNNER
ncbi:MAG: RagB/SusD family nutrient uptake outer membrane protein [Bacteroidales bacterium]|nr:RagB/SusD family nutrient uptake outer membrane protein [Bacteroidales bacterium]